MRVDEAFGYIRHAYETNHMPAALMIIGDIRGSAAELATQILQLLFCRKLPGPCGRCVQCQHVSNQTAFDVVWITPEKKSRQISIDQVRERLVRAVTQTSLEGGWKAGVLLAADRLTPQAANAFLKTLEEPPPQTLFLLLTDSPQNLLPTIVSRCQRIDVTDAAQPAAAAWRDNLVTMLSDPLPPGPISAMAISAQLCALLAEMKGLVEQEARAEVKEETEVEISSDVLNARIDARYREWRQQVLIALQNWFRDLLVLRAGGDEAPLHYPQARDLLQARTKHLTLAQALANVAAVDGMQRQLERNLSENYVFAYWLDRVTSGVQPERNA